MDPAMSEEIEAVRDMVNRFMQNEVVPVMDQMRSAASSRGSSSGKPAKRVCTAPCFPNPWAAATWVIWPRR